MKRKHVYLVDDLAEARAAIAAARHAGATDDDIALVARNDIEMEVIPEDRRNASTDFVPAALKGALGGIAGTWSSALIGSALPDPVRRRFEEEIAAGRILVVVDIPDESLSLVDTAVQATGAVLLPFEEPSAMT